MIGCHSSITATSTGRSLHLTDGQNTVMRKHFCKDEGRAAGVLKMEAGTDIRKNIVVSVHPFF